MVTDYNHGRIAEDYRQAKAHAWRTQVEDHSLRTVLGDITGRRVLDLACGEGHVTRQLAAAGAATVIGSDISEKMIRLAHAQEQNRPLGITYLVEDASRVAARPDFDMVVSAWLLVYARDRVELEQMCRGVASRVRSGGRFVTVITNPGLYDFEPLPDYRKYGFTIDLHRPATDGAPIWITLLLGDSGLTIENYYLPLTAYRQALTAAGFHDVRAHRPTLAPDDDSPPGFWNELLARPSLLLLEGVRD